MKKLKGYGIKSDGTAVDIDSPNFRIEEYISVALNEVMTYAEFVKAYPDFSFKCKDFPHPISERTNGGKPHVCGKIAVYDGDRGVPPLCCGICDMPIDTPKKEDIFDISDEHVTSDKVSLAIDDILSSIRGKITEVHAQELKDMILSLVGTCSSKKLSYYWEKEFESRFACAYSPTDWTTDSHTVGDVKNFIYQLIAQARKDVLDSIAQGEGWEETKEFYAKELKIK